MKTKIECPRCSGHGLIGAFAHIANGICFLCNGTKTIEFDRNKAIAKLTIKCRTQAEWVLQSTVDNYSQLSFRKLSIIRNFCHGGWGLQEAYPTLLTYWFETGEAAFQTAQVETLNAF